MQNRLAHLTKTLHKSQAEITEEVVSIATLYPDMIKVYVPFTAIKRHLPDWEFDQKTNKYADSSPPNINNESAEERSIRRSQRTVRDYIMCNRFELFATITFSTDRHNIERSKKKLYTWLKNQRDRNGKFSYLVVAEYHKDGALHFHILLKNYTGRLKESRSSKTNRLLTSHGKPVFEFDEYKSGFTKVQYIGNTPEDYAKIGNYVRKYITKDMVSVFGKKRFWASRGLKKPIQEDNPAWFSDLTPDYVYENDYGRIYTYTNLWKHAVPDEIRAQTRFDEE